MNLRPVRQIMVAAIFVMAAGVAWPATVTWKTLRGHVPSVVAKLSAVGTLPGTNRLHLAIGLPLRDPAGLDVFLAQLADPASTNYRHYLTPGQFTERFGPTAADYAAVTQFAATNGLTVTATHGNRLLLDVSGTAAATRCAATSSAISPGSRDATVTSAIPASINAPISAEPRTVPLRKTMRSPRIEWANMPPSAAANGTFPNLKPQQPVACGHARRR